MTASRRKSAGGWQTVSSPASIPAVFFVSVTSCRPEAATFINSAMIRNFDFNDRYPGGHPSDCLGALLTLAGTMKVDGKEFLTSMIVVYEIFARLSDATMLSRRGWDQGYAIGVATAAGVCNLLKLSTEATAHAVGIAATSN